MYTRLEHIDVGCLNGAARVPIVTAIVGAVIAFGLALLGTYVVAQVIDNLAPRYGGTRNLTQAFKVSAYSSTAQWLADALDAASSQLWGKPAAYMGEGGSIPFMGMLGEKFPDTQFVITGVLGPHSNAHGPNEFLHIPTGKRVTAAVARLIVAHHARPR